LQGTALFPAGKNRIVVVKVIDPWRNEVMNVDKLKWTEITICDLKGQSLTMSKSFT
jgi:hypothetical protein